MTAFNRNDERHKMGAVVEIVEIAHPSQDPAELPVIKTSVVYVNGTPVGLIARDGIDLDPGDGVYEATTLRLELMPREVLVRAVAETPDGVVDGEA